MGETETETPQTDPQTDVETEIAEQMTPDEQETPEVDPAEVTGPGPDSPFQPPDLHPDEPEAEPSPDDEETEPEALADYAPGVAEARLQTEREAEKLGKDLDKERKRHGTQVMKLL